MNFIFKTTIFSITGAIAIWLLGNTVFDLWTYHRLSKYTAAEVKRWRIKEISSSEFALEASYRYEVNGQKWKGKGRLSKPYYLNSLAANKAVQEKSAQRWIVWYIPSKPHVSSLEKNFPYKNLFNALCGLGVVAYFCVLFNQQRLSEA